MRSGTTRPCFAAASRRNKARERALGGARSLADCRVEVRRHDDCGRRPPSSLVVFEQRVLEVGRLFVLLVLVFILIIIIFFFFVSVGILGLELQVEPEFR